MNTSIIVLGCGMQPSGLITKDGILSLKLASALWRKYADAQVIFAGGMSYKAEFTSKFSEALSMQRYACEQMDLSADRCKIEDQSKDTLGGLVYCYDRFLNSTSQQDVIVIAGPNHSKERLDFLCKKVFGKNISYVIEMHKVVRASELAREKESLGKLHVLLHDVENGDVAKINEIMKSQHPAYIEDTE